MSEISVDSTSIAEKSAALQAASSNFNGQALNPTDSRTTITANSNARDAFAGAVLAHGLFADAAAASSGQMKAIENAFTAADTHSVGRFQTQHGRARHR